MAVLLPHAHEPGFPQYPEVTRDPRLAHGGEGPAELSRSPFMAREEVEHLTTGRVCKR